MVIYLTIDMLVHSSGRVESTDNSVLSCLVVKDIVGLSKNGKPITGA